MDSKHSLDMYRFSDRPEWFLWTTAGFTTPRTHISCLRSPVTAPSAQGDSRRTMGRLAQNDGQAGAEPAQPSTATAPSKKKAHRDLNYYKFWRTGKGVKHGREAKQRKRAVINPQGERTSEPGIGSGCEVEMLVTPTVQEGGKRRENGTVVLGERLFCLVLQEKTWGNHRVPAGSRPPACRKRYGAAAPGRAAGGGAAAGGRAGEGRRQYGGPLLGAPVRSAAPAACRGEEGPAGTGPAAGLGVRRGGRALSHLQGGHRAGEEVLAVLQLLEVGGPRLPQRRRLPLRRHLPLQPGCQPRPPTLTWRRPRPLLPRDGAEVGGTGARRGGARRSRPRPLLGGSGLRGCRREAVHGRRSLRAELRSVLVPAEAASACRAPRRGKLAVPGVCLPACAAGRAGAGRVQPQWLWAGAGCVRGLCGEGRGGPFPLPRHSSPAAVPQPVSSEPLRGGWRGLHPGRGVGAGGWRTVQPAVLPPPGWERRQEMSCPVSRRFFS